MIPPRLIVTGRKMEVLLYPPGSCVYAVKGDTTNSIDNMRNFPGLYLRSNNEGGGHCVNSIHTIQRCSACRVVGIKKRPIPMDVNVIKTIYKQPAGELHCVGFANIDMETTSNNYEERGDDSNSDFEDDDKPYETSDAFLRVRTLGAIWSVTTLRRCGGSYLRLPF